MHEAVAKTQRAEERLKFWWVLPFGANCKKERTRCLCRVLKLTCNASSGFVDVTMYSKHAFKPCRHRQTESLPSIFVHAGPGTTASRLSAICSLLATKAPLTSSWPSGFLYWTASSQRVQRGLEWTLDCLISSMNQGITSEGRATRPTEGARITTCP